jgi:phosphoribosylformylglycinamidine synthase
LSSPATDFPPGKTNTILELPGQFALSKFRLRKILQELRHFNDKVTDLHARFTYYVDISRDLKPEQRQHLDALLLSDDDIQHFPKDAILVHTAPRPGTISPWSAKRRK